MTKASQTAPAGALLELAVFAGLAVKPDIHLSLFLDRAI